MDHTIERAVRSRTVRRTTGSLGVLVLLTAVSTAGVPSVIRIHSGDTLSQLAVTHQTSVARLQALNGLTGTMIYAGELLKLPGSAVATPTARSAGTVSSYTVRSGDSLIALARSWHTTADALAARNNLRSRNLLIGQKLTRLTPAAAATPAVRAAQPVVGTSRVAQSAALHREALASQRLPSTATVRQLIRSAAARHGVPASFALSVAYQESGFQQHVVSPVDAIGVMQVLPSTGRSLGRLHGREYDLLQASDNIEAGVMLLKDLLDSTGTRPAALQGYYQGLGSISRQGILPQTHQYVRNILALEQQRFS